jgi:CRP/FNR family cyclic AMP-dependent transcriptional regulator
MITPEMLRLHSFFKSLSQAELETLAKISDDVTFEDGEVIFRESHPADALYILLKGNIELYFLVEVEYHPEYRKELVFETIKPGDTFGISALIEPYILTSTARALKPSRVIRIDAVALRELCAADKNLAYTLTNLAAMLAIDRLNNTRLALAMVHPAMPS